MTEDSRKEGLVIGVVLIGEEAEAVVEAGIRMYQLRIGSLVTTVEFGAIDKSTAKRKV